MIWNTGWLESCKCCCKLLVRMVILTVLVWNGKSAVPSCHGHADLSYKKLFVKRAYDHNLNTRRSRPRSHRPPQNDPLKPNAYAQNNIHRSPADNISAHNVSPPKIPTNNLPRSNPSASPNGLHPKAAASQPWSFTSALQTLKSVLSGIKSSSGNSWDWIIQKLGSLDRLAFQFPLRHPIPGVDVRAGAQLNLAIKDTDGFSSNLWYRLGGMGKLAKATFPIKLFAVPEACQPNAAAQADPIAIAQCIRQNINTPAVHLSKFDSITDPSQVSIRIPLPTRTAWDFDGLRGLAQILDELYNHDGICISSDHSIVTAAVAHRQRVFTVDIVASMSLIPIPTTPYADPCGRLLDTIPRTKLIQSKSKEQWLWQAQMGPNTRPQLTRIANNPFLLVKGQYDENAELWQNDIYPLSATILFSFRLTIKRTLSPKSPSEEAGFGAMFELASALPPTEDSRKRVVVWFSIATGRLILQIRDQTGTNEIAQKRAAAGYPLDMLDGTPMEVLFIWRPGAKSLEVMIKQDATGHFAGLKPRTWSTQFPLSDPYNMLNLLRTSEGERAQIRVGIKAVTEKSPFSAHISSWQVSSPMPDLARSRVWFVNKQAPLPNQIGMVLLRLFDEHGRELHAPVLPVKVQLRRLQSNGAPHLGKVRVSRRPIKGRVKMRQELGLLEVYFKAKVPGRYLIFIKIKQSFRYGRIKMDNLYDPVKWTMVPNHHVYVRHIW